jgi:hypothetical protein
MAGQPPAHTGHFKPFVSATPPPGPDGTLGMAVLSAVVGADATVARGAGVTGAIHAFTGGYEVDFNRDVTACTYVASIGVIADSETEGETDVASRTGTPNGVWVETYPLGATTAVDDRIDKSFHLLVFCAK